MKKSRVFYYLFYFIVLMVGVGLTMANDFKEPLATLSIGLSAMTMGLVLIRDLDDHDKKDDK